MSDDYFELVRREEYPQFRTLLAHLPETFEQWEARTSWEKAQTGGANCIDVAICFRKFKQWCVDNSKKAPTRQDLNSFTYDWYSKHGANCPEGE